MAKIEFKNISKSFGDTEVINNFNLTIDDGEFTVLVGPSGCGKTTILRMLAGLGPQTSGQIFVDGKDISEVPASDRDIAMVFQDYAIYPTMTVRGNIDFGLKNIGVPKEKREKLVNETTEIVGIKEYLDRKPGTLSGGQRQRIALCRAMVKKPKVFLMDEPLSNLDAKLRVAMRVELIELHQRLKSNFIYVTHDQIEAMSMADKIVLIDKGKIKQCDSPENIYNDPENVFTAQFIGTPPMNVFDLDYNDSKYGFRPEKAKISYKKQNLLYSREGKIITREMLGAETIYKILVKGIDESVMVSSQDHSFSVEEKVYISLAEKDIYLFDKNEDRIWKTDSNYEDHISVFKKGVGSNGTS